ncbi:MAG TPA: hypothetical protein VFL64_12425 [Rhizobacter sp.]|nr:hypothetical protein [Rhizobacter sp.]
MTRSALPSRTGRCLAACAAALAAASAQAAPPANDGQWHFSLTPYLWLPNVNSTLKYPLPPGGGGSADAETGPNSYLENLQSLLMLSGEARRNEWAIVSDLVYLNFGDEDSQVSSVGGPGAGISIPRERNLGTRTDLKGWTWMVAGSYTAVRTEAATLDVLAGMRLLHIQGSLDWTLDASIPGSGFTFARTGSVERSETLVDAIVGVRGRVWFGDDGKWFLPYHLDVGAGESKFTYQAVAGVGYAFGWGEVQLAYRELSWEQPDDKFVQKLRFSGPALGLSWRF